MYKTGFGLLLATAILAGCTADMPARPNSNTVLIDAIAQKHNLCIDRRRSEISHCIEI
jgi:outer membrane biogenesis lipoprotein LolB